MFERINEPDSHLGIGAADFQLLGPGNLRFGKFATPAVVIAIEPSVTSDETIKAYPWTVTDIAGSNNVTGANRTGKAVSIPVITPASAL